MQFWNRRKIYFGNLSGCNLTKRLLEQNGIAVEEKTLYYPNGISPETRSRMDSLGQSYDTDTISLLYVHRRDAARAARLLGKLCKEEVR